MGSFFNNMLVENHSLDMLMGGLTKALKPLGLIPAEEEEADCTIRIYGELSDKFLVFVAEWPEQDMDKLTGRIAKAIGGRVIGVQCLDSDVLILSLTKGGGVSVAYVGDPEAYDIMPKPLRQAPWKELVGEEGWDGFLAVLNKEVVCAEEALQPLARLIGFSSVDTVRYPDDPGEPLMVCTFKRRKEIPEYLPDNLLPAFRSAGYTLEQGSLMVSYTSDGGYGQGIGVLIVANGIDAGQLKIKSIGVSRAFHYFRESNVKEAEAKQVQFDNGHFGWVAKFPDVEILAGTNPDHPKVNSLEGIERQNHRKYYVIFAVESSTTRFSTEITALDTNLAIDVYLVPLLNKAGEAVVRIGLANQGK